MNKQIPDGEGEMGPVARLSEVPAAALVSAVRFSSAHRLTMSVVALAATLVVGVVYLTFGVFHLSPISSKITVRVHFSISGGLLPQQEVMLRGVPVGKVNSVELTDSGVVAVAEIDGGVEIPLGGEVRVAGLSMAGEQYLDFRPTTDNGPYLVDGSEISSEETSTPVPLASMLGNLDGMLAQIDPAELRDDRRGTRRRTGRAEETVGDTRRRRLPRLDARFGITADDNPSAQQQGFARHTW